MLWIDDSQCLLKMLKTIETGRGTALCSLYSICVYTYVYVIFISVHISVCVGGCTYSVDVWVCACIRIRMCVHVCVFVSVTGHLCHAQTLGIGMFTHLPQFSTEV